jgi:NADPH-dependent 2,4-dienoyl-CoA reductase/sulfur reductase-like enzyme
MRLVVVGGSDAGIEAARRAVEVDRGVEARVLVADAYPNFSICGIPYHVSGEVPDWRRLAHRGVPELEAEGLRLALVHRVTAVDVDARTVAFEAPTGPGELSYDRLVLATGADPQRPPIAGLDSLGSADGVHVLHSMGDTFGVTEDLRAREPRSAVVVGAGYIGMEMAEALTTRGVEVTVVEQLPQVLPRTLDHALAMDVEEALAANQVALHTGTAVERIERDGDGLRVETAAAEFRTDLVLVVTGVVPNTTLAATAGATLGAAGSIVVDERMRTNLPDVYAAGDCVHTHHRLLASPTYLPLGTTAHKQGRIAGANAAGRADRFAGTLGTQVVKVFDRVVAATGLRDEDARAAGYQARTVAARADDHKAYYPGATTIRARITGDALTGRLLGAQLVGRLGAEVAKRIDIFATAIHHEMTVEELADLDLSYTPPLGSPWDAVQIMAFTWARTHVRPGTGL